MAAAALVGWAGTAHAQPYVFTPFQAGSFARGVNDAGQVVGNWDRQATLWSGTTTTILQTLPGHSSSVAWGINAAGQVVGESLDTQQGRWRSTLWNASMPSTLAGLPSGSWGRAINASGQVAGFGGDSTGGTRAALWNGTAASDLLTLGAHASYAYGINASGQVVGSSSLMYGGTRATVWNGTSATVLGTLGGNYSVGYGINASGQVVGFSEDPLGSTRATLWNGTTPTDLGTLGGPSGWAWGINASGQVVGFSTNSAGQQRATLWDGTSATDLTSFLSAADISAGWVLSYATAISDNGSITGNAFNDTTGTTHAFLLTPVPEPGTWQLLLGGLGVLGMAARRRTTRHAARRSPPHAPSTIRISRSTAPLPSAASASL